MAYCIGLTGGIGCGKTAATDCFAALGAGVVDTDIISRQLTAAGGGAMSEIAAEFGPQYVAPDGSLDRVRMREVVFTDPSARRRLEAILHPLIRSTAATLVLAAPEPYVLLVVPLLLENDAYDALVDRVLVIDCDEAQQVARVMARSNLSEAEVRKIMSTQLSRAERLARADDVLANDADIKTLQSRVEELHRRYLAAATGKA